MTRHPEKDRIIHDIKNLLSALLLSVENLASDRNYEAPQQLRLSATADLVQELLARVDDLAQAIGTDSDLSPQGLSRDRSRIFPIEGEVQRRQYSQLAKKLPRSRDAAAVGKPTLRAVPHRLTKYLPR